MNQQKYISPRIFVFSKWSRKKYAIFASLGKLIKIGVLKADICQKALLKGLVDLAYFANIEGDFDEDENDLSIKDRNSLQFMLSSLGLSVFPAFKLTSNSISKKGNSLKNYIIQRIQSLFFTKRKKQTFFSTYLEFHKSLNYNY